MNIKKFYTKQKLSKDLIESLEWRTGLRGSDGDREFIIEPSESVQPLSGEDYKTAVKRIKAKVSQGHSLGFTLWVYTNDKESLYKRNLTSSEVLEQVPTGLIVERFDRAVEDV